MAWTTPKTWSAGETLTAANFNAQIRDNLNALGPHLIVRKTADESVTTNTTPQDDNDLILPLAANEVWQFEFCVLAEGDLGDINFGFSFPASGRISARTVTTDPSAVLQEFTVTQTATPTGEWASAFLNTSPSYRPIIIEGVFVNSSTAGNLVLQWAQNSSSGTGTTVKANSTLRAVKLA